MKKFAFNSIKTRLTTWFLILTLIPLMFVLSMAYVQWVNITEESTFDKLTAIRDLKGQQLSIWINEKMKDLHVMSEDDEIDGLGNILSKKNKSKEDLQKIGVARELLDRNQRNYIDYEEIFIISANSGLIEISTNNGSVGSDKSKDSYFTVPLNTREKYIKDIYYSPTLGKPAMALAIPIFHSNDTKIITGVLVVRINLEKSLYPLLLNRTGLGETGETLLINEDVVALNELRWHENAPLELKIVADPAIKASQGNTGIVVTTDYRGVEILAAYTYIPETKWGFVVKQDMEELNAPIKDMMLNFLLLFIITGLAIIVLAVSISTSITKPMVDLNIVAQKIGDGDLSVRNTIESSDELGSLAKEFNKMADLTELKLKTQKGVSEISETMIGKYSMQEFSAELLKQLMKISNATMSVFYGLNEAASKFEHVASIGANKKLLKDFDAKNPEGEMSNAVSKKEIYYFQDIPESTIFNYKTTAGDANPKEIITIPVMENSTVVALISLVNVHEFSEESYEILKQSWASINTSYLSLIATEKTKTLAENLLKTNQRLEYQSEELELQTTELQQSSLELKEQNVELEMQKVQLNEASRLKTTFLSNMSHELRTPLNSVIALSGVLNRKLFNQIPNEEYGYLSIIQRNGKHLLSLINNILDISRIESGNEEIEITKFNLNGLVSEIIDMLYPLAEKKYIQLIQKDSDAEIEIQSDISKCRHILQNIIGNAVKFTEIGKVEVAVQKIKGKISISCTDTGIGIQKEMIPYVFDEFRQVDDTTSKKYEGTGLGLYIAKKYADLIGGTISVKSTLGKGSEFSVLLPLTYDMGNITEEEEKTTKRSFKQTPPNLTHEFSTKTILLVDDNEPVIIQVKYILEEMGYNILVAHDGNEALEVIEHTIPDGIVLDLMMPDVDGFGVLKKLREIKRTENVPVLILSAKHITKQELKFLKRNNVHQLIQKGDIKRNELLNTISEMVFPEIEKAAAPKRVLQNIKGKPVVLIVEDNIDNMITVKAMLTNNYTILEATDGKEALKLAKENQPNLVLMDIALPKMDGFEAFKEIRKIKELNDTPIIALTASAMVQDRETILEFGFDSYIPKPIDEKIFYKTIDKLLYGK